MRRSIVYILSKLVLAASLGGCAFAKDKGKEKSEPDEFSTYSIKSFLIDAQETEVLEQYKVIFAWPKDPSVKIEIIEEKQVTELKEVKEIPVAFLPGELGYFEMNAHSSDEQRVYRIKVIDYTGKPLGFDRRVIPIPKDKEIIDSATLDADKKWELNRLVVHDNAIINTNYNSLHIVANSISFGKNAKLITLESEKLLIPRAPTRPPLIEIRAKRISGELNVFLRGYKGATGKSGDEFDRDTGFVERIDPSLKGERGKDGFYKPSTVAQKQTAANACPLGQWRSTCQMMATASFTTCTTQPENGKKGAQGAKGSTGGKGERGGATGSLIVVTEGTERFLLTTYFREGIGGNGGPGGTGRSGGEGGDPGSAPAGITCNTANKGETGDRGLPGDIGASGDLGEKGATQILGEGIFPRERNENEIQ